MINFKFNPCRQSVLLTSLLCSSAACASPSDRAAASTPNILLINIDDLGWSDMSFQGSGYYQTPNLDEFRREALFFDNAYAGAANSAPARSSLMTGVYAPRHGVYTVLPADRGKASERKLIAAECNAVPDPSFPILAERMREGGYSTYHLGKWHLGDDPTLQGFDVNVGGYIKGHPSSYFSPYKNPNLTDGEDGEFLTDRLTDEAINILESYSEGSSKPFFIYFATYAVHTPLQPKAELAAKYADLEGTEAHSNHKYAALIESTDTNLGRIFDYLEQSGLDKNTVVILTSDNGGLYSISKQWPLRAGKGSFYEGGIRVPIMVRWCGVTEENSTNSTPISQLDLYPTILNIADIPTEDQLLDGRDITPMLCGEQLDSTPIFWHFPAYLENGGVESTDPIFRSRPVSVIRDGDWKLIYNYESGVKELYNLKDDISEKSNLAPSESARAEQLYSKLQAWLAETNAPTEFELNPKYKDYQNE